MEENDEDTKGGGKKRDIENERETETKRMRGREKKITNREERSEKGKTFVTLFYRTIGRKNNIINLLTFQYCINLAAGLSGETCTRTGHAWDFPPERTQNEQNKTKPVSRQSALPQNSLDIDSRLCHSGAMCRHVGSRLININSV